MAELDKLHILLRLVNKQAKQTMKNSSGVSRCVNLQFHKPEAVQSDTFGVGLVYL